MGMNKWNSAPARLMPSEEENPGGGPLAQAGVFSWRHQFFGNFDTWSEQGAHGSGDEDVEVARVRADFTKFKGGNAVMQSHVARAGYESAALVTRYSLNSGGTFTDLATVPIAAANPNAPAVGPRIAVPDAALVNNLLLKLVRRGGNGTITPALWNAIIDVASGAGSGRPSDLPEGDWGTLLWDINSFNLDAIYADNAEVPFFPDERGSYDASTAGSTVVNAPHYRATGMSGGLPCVQTTGLNLPLLAGNPTKPFGSWTYYFVVSELDGGDVGFILNGESGYPFGFGLWATASDIAGQVNTNAFGSTVDSATVSLSGKHIYRFVKESGASHWYLYRDGVLVADEFANPQVNDTVSIRILDAAGGLGMDAKLGRGVAYSRAHLAPTALATSPANGLTAPEIVLKAQWGTP
jgi:hypothetical protein